MCEAGTTTPTQTGTLNQTMLNQTRLNQTVQLTSETQTKPMSPHQTSDVPQKVIPISTCPPLLPATTPYNSFIFKKEYFTALVVVGGLILACTFLLISTLVLAVKVCQLSRRVRMLSGHSDLMSAATNWKENSKKKENKSKTDAKETTELMADFNQTRDKTGDASTEPDTENRKEEKEKVCENGVEQKEKGASNEEAKETPATVIEFSSEEESGDSQTPKPEEVSSSEDKKESKDAE